jgi:hypothetical protein
VLDLHHDQVQLLAAVYGTVASWWAQPGYRQRPLGHMLKVVPADVADTTARLLRAAGFLPPTDERSGGVPDPDRQPRAAPDHLQPARPDGHQPPRLAPG